VSLLPFSKASDMTMANRRGFKQLTLQDRLTAWADKTRAHASELEPGPLREALLKKAEQAETAAGHEAWSRSARLQPFANARRPLK
jgi:hypothetical protein